MVVRAPVFSPVFNPMSRRRGGLPWASSDSTVAPSLLTAGLVAHYKLDEGSGQVAFNHAAASQANPFSLVGAPEQNFNTNDVLWTKANLTITDSYAANPVDGAITASRAVSTAGVHYLYQGSFTIGAGNYHASMWIKSNTGADQYVKFFLVGDFSTPDILVPASGAWTLIEQDFVSAGGTGEFYILGYNDAQSAIDVTFYDARIEAGTTAGADRAPTLWHMQLGPEANEGADSQEPSWSSAGLVYSTGSSKFTVAGSTHDFDAMSVYAVVKRSGSPVFANYLPIFSSLISTDTDGLHLAGMHDNYFPYLRWGDANENTVGYGATLEDGLDHVIAGTYDGDYLRLYLDGVEIERKQIGAIGTVTLNRLFLGNFAFGAYWAGNIYYAALYDVAHAKSQVQSQTNFLSVEMAARGITVNEITTFISIDGDSISSPRASPTGEHMWPYKTLEAISPRPQGRNFSEPGSIIADINPAVPSLARRLPELLAGLVAGARNIVFIADGHNDCASATFRADYTALIQDIRSYATTNSLDVRIICATILPSTGVPFATTTSESQWIRDNYVALGANRVCDWAANATMGPEAAASDTSLYTDGTHPTDLGHDYLTVDSKAAIEAEMA